MSLGKRIRKVRTFRELTQRELGELMGWDKNGDVRIAQYEKGTRTPKKPIQIGLADALDISPSALTACVGTTIIDFMESLLWLEEFEGEDAIQACIQEWQEQKSRLSAGEITKDEYFEWKLRWTEPRKVDVFQKER